MIFPICSWLRPRSFRTTGISGAIPNHPKKQRKNVIQVIWNARIGGVLKSRRLIFEAFEERFCDMSYLVIDTYKTK